MNLAQLIDLVGDYDVPIVLIASCGWLGTFPAMYCPTMYEEYKVTAIMPDEDKGLFTDDMCLKVWVEDNGEP